MRAAIARAANSTGVDFNYLLAQARLESSLDPSARAGTSSAAGLYQFTRGTWLQTLDRHGGNHGLDWTSAAIEDGRVQNPALRQQIMALRFDPDASALMAAELASDNADHLSGVLGRAPDAAELYMAHFLGAGGAGQFLRALADDPGQSAAALDAQGGSGQSRNFLHRQRRTALGQRGHGPDAREDGARDGPRCAGAPAFRPSRQSRGAGASWSAASAETGSGISSAPTFQAGEPARPSMAETLRETFALGNGDSSAAGQQVRAAYGKLKAFGL